MKSQPDIQIRRLAVFTGYGDAEAEILWSRRTHDDSCHLDLDTHGTVRPLRRDHDYPVIELERVARPVHLQHAA